MIAARIHPRPLGRLDDHLGAVDVHGDDVRTLVDEPVGGLGLFDGQRPVAGEDDARCGLGVDLAGAEGKKYRLSNDLFPLPTGGGEGVGDPIQTLCSNTDILYAMGISYRCIKFAHLETFRQLARL